jgi:hypothetical protein
VKKETLRTEGKKKRKRKGNQKAKMEAFVSHEGKNVLARERVQKKVLYRKRVFCSSQLFTLTAF